MELRSFAIDSTEYGKVQMSMFLIEVADYMKEGLGSHPVIIGGDDQIGLCHQKICATTLRNTALDITSTSEWFATQSNR